MDPYTTLTVGVKYQHSSNGSRYFCKKNISAFDAILVRESDNWTFLAHGIRLTPDGKIHWNYSTGGHWDEKL